MDCITIKTIMDEENGRFLQTKLKDNKGTGKIIFNNVYLEPDNQTKEVIPKEIWESEHITGDLNQIRTNFEKLANVYHIKNIGQVSKIIPIPNKISDHPIIILKLEVPIKIKDIFEKIIILDIEIINNNIEAIEAITINEQNIVLKEPR